MKTLCLILQLLLFFATSPAQKPDSILTADTSRDQRVVIVDPGIALGKSTLLFPSFLQPEREFESMLFAERRPGVRPSFLQSGYEPKNDLLSPYLLQLSREHRLSTLQTVLGAMELGGAAYIAYRHIKKYGFLR